MGGELRLAIKGFVAGEQGASPRLEPGALREHDEFGPGKLPAERGENRGIVRDTAGQQDAAEFAPPLFEQSDHFIGHAVVQRVEDVLDRGFIAVELVRNVRFAMNRAARGQRHDLAIEGTADCLVDAKPHAANLLHKELAAAGGAFVVREDVTDSSGRDQVNQE